MAIVIDNGFEIGQQVYLTTDTEQRVRLVFAIIVYKSGELMYELVCNTIASKHYAFEISETKNLLVNVS
jgi:hypothetical protein